MLHVFTSCILDRYYTWRDTMNKICIVCGKPFKGSADIVTCPDCRGTVLKQRTFGTKNCVWCGKEFVAKSPRQESCGDKHYLPCPDCGKLVEVKETYHNFMKNGGKPRRCSACRRKAISESRKSFSEAKKQEIREKSIATTQSRYGVDFAMQSKAIKEKQKATVRDRYGVDNISQNKEVREKITATVNNRYGGYTLASPILRSRVINTIENNYSKKGG